MSIGLLRALVQNGKIDTAKAEELQKKLQNGDERRFTDVLFAEKIITPIALAEFVSTLFGYPLMDLSIPKHLLPLLTLKIMRKIIMIPLRFFINHLKQLKPKVE